MNYLKFSAKDLILIINFLSHLAEESDVHDMDKGQLMACLLHILTKTAALEYQSTSSRSLAVVLSSWPEAVPYFLRNYATEVSICEETNTLESLKQMKNETEMHFHIV